MDYPLVPLNLDRFRILVTPNRVQIYNLGVSLVIKQVLTSLGIRCLGPYLGLKGLGLDS